MEDLAHKRPLELAGAFGPELANVSQVVDGPFYVQDFMGALDLCQPLSQGGRLPPIALFVDLAQGE
ncbi:MAG: hypothetical protein ABSB57_02445 [Dehalococcoidia bacterium]